VNFQHFSCRGSLKSYQHLVNIQAYFTAIYKQAYSSRANALAGKKHVLGYGLDERVFESRQGLGIFLFTTVPRPTMGPTQPPIQWVAGALSLGVKRPVREADKSPPSSAAVIPPWGGAQSKHKDNFTFYFYLT
jgi:hypothetical protein